MNFSDSEIVASILCENGYVSTPDYNEADLVLVNTCSIRENAEQRVRNRLKNFHVVKRRNPNALIGVLGCMAERLKEVPGGRTARGYCGRARRLQTSTEFCRSRKRAKGGERITV